MELEDSLIVCRSESDVSPRSRLTIKKKHLNESLITVLPRASTWKGSIVALMISTKETHKV